MTGSIRVTFPGHGGTALAGRLELPAGEPGCYATFAHCYTCSKDNLAAYRISKALAELGIATLRFDFAGLGDSGGNFADTDFSSNVADLAAAADYLAHHHAPPALLIGHSLGGTASLVAARHIGSARGVITIASPSQPAHVLHHFGDAMTELNSGRNASIMVAGSAYEVAPGFVDDVLDYDLEQTLGSLQQEVMVFCVEGDDIVDEHNAVEIRRWAPRGPEIVMLRDTDHVVSDRATTSLIARRIHEFATDLL